MMNLNALKIDPEFQGKIPPLNFEEEQQLEQNILHEGRLLNPIIIWNGFILDGHTRYRILRKHPFIAYQIQEIELDNRYAALSWMRLRIRTVWMPSRNYCRPPFCGRQDTLLPDILVFLNCVR